MLEGDGGALFPPLRFSPVESGVYRGGFPAVRNFPFLGTLDLRTVVSLAPEVTPDLQSWCEAEQVDLKLFSGRLLDDTLCLSAPVCPVNIDEADNQTNKRTRK